MTDFRALIPARSDRVLLCGQTGSGKTTLARELLRTRKYAVALDTKGMLQWDDYRIYRDLRKLFAAKEPRLIYRPGYDALQDEDAMDAFFQWVYIRGNTTLYVDETAQISRGDTFPFFYGSCLMQGREHGVEVWSATQRPMRIPQIAMSEAEHTYCFYLRMPQDRDRVEAFSGIDSDAIEALQKRQFLYARDSSRESVGPLTLAL